MHLVVASRRPHLGTKAISELNTHQQCGCKMYAVAHHPYSRYVI